ncbi:DUF1501 domain-containing protein [Aliiglaciecola sp. M165]|uniref:DUF1501 domain-containing protein n=1 Tax=Aliiglaciecola sp. M165 TaxID=2593649 RepID=UPI00117CDF0E|nr:DUF1501 domain-containing protein [Aliiglaciecola sp. M165]TRY30887.1 DUF1501 domain-containing protein [Aliiglaciecola sp. M165]
MTITRRRFIQGLSASSVAVASMGTTLSTLNAFNSYAMPAEDYKALVCVFFLGGMDTHDMLLPYDQGSYLQFSTLRQSLISAQGSNRLRENLLPLSPINEAMFGGRQFALPPEMPELHQLFEQGNATIIGNVGPLIEPTNKLAFENQSARLPARLFSHNDQQATWQSSAPEGAQYGWGGLFADAALASNPQSAAQFSTITGSGNELFLTGQIAQPYQISTEGAAQIALLQELSNAEDGSIEQQIYQQLRAHFQPRASDHTGVLKKDVANVFSKAYQSNLQYNQASENAMTLQTVFPMSPMGSQLQAVAKTISIRNELNVNRQIFFVGIGGFDTHSDQAQDLPSLQAQIDGGVGAFFRAMEEMGLTDNVTLFSASDFGRTLAVNGDGTDHGWGSHHFAVGGAVNGKQILGSVPPPTLGHSADAGSGRLIPSVAVEQLAAPLGRWFGLTDAQIAASLPNLANFSDPELTLMMT